MMKCLTNRNTRDLARRLASAVLVTVGMMVGGGVVGGAGGCAQQHAADVDYARAYPQQVTLGPTLDIQVFGRATTIELTNATAREFGPSTIWLNALYAMPIESLEIGESLTLPLAGFRNEFNETIRAGGFFATRRPDRLVLVQIEEDASPGTMLGMIVVASDAK